MLTSNKIVMAIVWKLAILAPRVGGNSDHVGAFNSREAERGEGSQSDRTSKVKKSYRIPKMSACHLRGGIKDTGKLCSLYI